MQYHSRRRIRILIVACTLIALAVAGFAAFQLAIRSLKTQVEQVLGPNGEVKEMRVGLAGIEAVGIRIRATRGKGAAWPAEDELRAERILVAPDILGLLTTRIPLDTIRIEGAYISMLRDADGQMKVIPSLHDAPRPPSPPETSAGKPAAGDRSASPPPRKLSIDRIVLANGTIEFFDASLRKDSVKIRLEQINAVVGKIEMPELKGHTPIKINGILKGNQQDGTLSIDGSIELSTKESGFSTKLHGVDMTVLQPYLIKATETGVKRGTLDLDLKSSVANGKLRAPGTLTLTDLELPHSSGTFMGMPHNTVIGLMKDRKGRISVKFLLEGDIDAPRFSLGEQMNTRLGSSLADAMGISLESLAIDIGSVGKGTTKGIGASLGKLFKK